MDGFRKVLATGMIVVATITGGGSLANAAGCSMVDYKLVCANGSKKLVDIAQAFAAKETTLSLKSIAPQTIHFPSGMVRENIGCR